MRKNICFPKPKLLYLVQLFLIALLINGSILYSTNSEKIDKLLIKFKSEKTVLKKIEVLNSILWESRYLHPETGIKYGNKALLLEEKHNYIKEKAQTLSLMGICHTSLKNYNTAL